MKQKHLTIKEYPSIGETLYSLTLPSGLKVYVLPKEQFNETYAVLTINVGSIDSRFTPVGEKELKTYPQGVVHFLEHKLFEDSESTDILLRFTELGAEGNAYTTFTKTSYLFSTTSEIEKNLSLLYELVSNYSFSEESIDREKSIIKQEIEMYLDNPDYKLFFATLSNLYPETELAADIAGTVDSVQEIRKTDLVDTYRKFYQASNMNLFIVGKIKVDNIVNQIEELDQELPQTETGHLSRYPITLNPVITMGTERLEVSTSKLAIAMRGRDVVSERERYRYKIILKLLFAMMFGWTSKRFQSLYEQGKIDHSLHLEVEVEENFHFVMLTLDAEEPLTLSHQLRTAIRQFTSDPDVTEEHLDTLKSEMFGDFLHGLNSIQYMAQNFESHQHGETIFDLPKILQSIHLADVLEIGHRFIDHCDMIDYTILPK